MNRTVLGGLAAGTLVAGAVLARRAVDVLDGPVQRVNVDGQVADGTAGGAPGLLRRDPAAAGRRGGPARLAPPSWEPRLLTALARWTPAPPATPAGRVAGYLWAAPMTLAGLVVAAAGAARPRLRDGVLLFWPARGPAGALLRRRGFTATALGHVVVAIDDPSAALMAHELTHVRQAERLGPFMAPLYLALTVVYGYARHPLERAARLAQRRQLGVDE